MSQIERVIKGLILFKEYNSLFVCATHDCIRAGLDTQPDETSKKMLNEWGWIHDPDENDWFIDV